MARSSRRPREVRERVVALVLEGQADYGSQWEAIAACCFWESTTVSRYVHSDEGSRRAAVSDLFGSVSLRSEG